MDCLRFSSDAFQQTHSEALLRHNLTLPVWMSDATGPGGHRGLVDLHSGGREIRGDGGSEDPSPDPPRSLPECEGVCLPLRLRGPPRHSPSPVES